MGLAGCFGRSPQTPLAQAAARGDAAEVRSLLQGGADPNGADGSRITPLMWAGRAGSVESIRALAAAGAALDTRDQAVNGWTALVHAIHKGQDDAADALLAAGADPNVRCDGGSTALMFAAAYGNARMVRTLLDRGADPHAEATGGVTALWNAAGGGGLFDFTDGPSVGTCHPEIVRALLERAPDLKLAPSFSTKVVKALSRTPECASLLARLQQG
jgi:ankyrin repeat protein